MTGLEGRTLGPYRVIAQIGAKKQIKWLTDILAGEHEPAVRAAAARALGEIGAPPKKEKDD